MIRSVVGFFGDVPGLIYIYNLVGTNPKELNEGVATESHESGGSLWVS